MRGIEGWYDKRTAPPERSAVIRSLLAEDMHMVRGALVALLTLEPDIEVVAEVASGDAILPAAGEIHEHLPDCRTLILTSLNRPGTLRRALAAKVGGFILEDAPADRLANAVRGVAAGRRVVDAELALSAWDPADCPLTSREIEVPRLAAAGANPTEIAARLYLSAGTVRDYLTTIVTKFQARNRVDAIRIAKESGRLQRIPEVESAGKPVSGASRGPPVTTGLPGCPRSPRSAGCARPAAAAPPGPRPARPAGRAGGARRPARRAGR
ncbi:Two-component system, response regulator [Saccharothrix espanaensis DSM 44229]|uniref:Two-component system, response regulator n=1 Tax=Saccharothrix espanaensis (strain ATCC 51144 / DSM 44229 / JCM 9112 / NBRC 15066 / NRRL 15764) TaxID=1179773 RepID=K0K2C7_SACES|nr:Two-component system, response regulator [Saccharothrix espanaensis DSM 44229]